MKHNHKPDDKLDKLELKALDELRKDMRQFLDLFKAELGTLQQTAEILTKLTALAQENTKLLRRILNEQKPKLSAIRINFGGNTMQGPLNLAVGQSSNATVLGFDQAGNPIAIDFAANPVTWTIDNPAAASSTPNADGSSTIAGVAVGSANLAATCGGFTDTQLVTVADVVPPPPVLSKIAIDFGTPTP